MHTVFAQDVSCCQYDAVMLLRLMFSIDDGDMRALLPCMRVYVYMLSLLYEAKNTIHNAIGNNNHKNPNLNHQVVVLVSAHRQMLGIYVPVYVSDDGGSYWTDEPCLSMCD